MNNLPHKVSWVEFGGGEVFTYFLNRERAEQWARQCGIFDRCKITIDENVFKILIKELSEINPIECNPDTGNMCFFCRQYWNSYAILEGHSPDCLYLRACQAAKYKA